MDANTPTRDEGRVRRGATLVSASLLLAGTGAVQLAGAPARLVESAALGAPALALGLLALATAAAPLIAPRRRTLVAAAAISLVMALLWVAAHTVGLPLGGVTWRPEPLSVPDLFTPALEVLAALLLAGAATRPRRPRPPRAWLTALLALPALVAGAVLAIGGSLAAPDDTWLVTSAAADAPPGPGAALAGQGGALFGPVRDALVGRGLVVASIDYRLAPLHPWPAQLDDAECAVRFLRAHAAELGRPGARGRKPGDPRRSRRPAVPDLPGHR